jgi:hypothetical protein
MDSDSKDTFIHASLSSMGFDYIQPIDLIEIFNRIESDTIKYRCFLKLRKSIPTVTITELVLLVSQFKYSDYKYKIFKELINNSYYLLDDISKVEELFVDNFNNNKISKYLIQLKKGCTYGYVIEMIKVYPYDKLLALEDTVKYSGLYMGDLSEYCLELKNIFNDTEFVKACEILGINPEAFEKYLSSN